MDELLTRENLLRENREYAGTPGISRENRNCGFLPAFRDRATGRVELSRFMNGEPAPMHILEGLPDCWVTHRDDTSRPTAILKSVSAGFVRDDTFYTRAEAVETINKELAMDSKQRGAMA